MQRNNIIVFAILTVIILGGWYLFTRPSEADLKKAQEQKEQHLAKVEEKKRKKKEAEAADEAAAIAASGAMLFGNADPLQVAVLSYAVGTTKPATLQERRQRDEAAAMIAKAKQPDKQPEVKRNGPQEKLETVTLGGEGFNLTADVINRGAGIRKLTLNRFQAANWRGLPAVDAAGKPKTFQLIQDDEHAPSYRMYHYLEPKDENPVLGLGEENWKIVKPDKAATTEKDGVTIVTGTDGKTVAKDKAGTILWEEIALATMIPGMDVAITKAYKLGAKDYHVSMLLTIEDKRAADPKAAKIPLRYQLTGAQGLPIEGEWYVSTYRNAFMALVDPGGTVARKLEDANRISLRRGGDRFPEDTRADNAFQYAGVANQFFGAMIVVEPKKEGEQPNPIIAWARPTLETQEKKGILTAFSPKDDTIRFRDEKGVEDNYTLLPRTKSHLEDDLKVETGAKIVLSSYTTPEGKHIATWARLGDTPRPQFDDITTRVNSEVIELYPGDKVEHPYMLYHGPVKVALLAQLTGDKAVDEELVDRYAVALHLNTLTDYHNPGWMGEISHFIRLTNVIVFVTRIMHWMLDKLHYVFGYGLSIVVLTIMVRGAMFPISRRQAMFSIKMQELQPELKKLQDKYPDDPQARMQAQQEFYRKHGINPLGSCWPMLLQMPIFLGLYFAFQESIHFRLANFLWIENLAAPDMLLGWTDHIPWISDPSNLGSAMYLGPYLNILPMIAVVFMMIQQSQTMPPASDEQQAAQQKMMKWMTIIFGIMFYKVAAGLCIYFISSSLWGLAERKLLPKKKPVETPAATGGTPAAATAGTNTAITAAAPQWKGKSKKDKDKEKVDAKNATTSPFERIKAMWRDILKAAEKK